MKRCSKCGAEKALDEFWVRSTAPDGRYYYCADCGREWHRQLWATRGGEHRMLRRMRQTYGLTDEQAQEMILRHGPVCWACGVACEPGRWWVVDHDHSCCDERKSCGRCVRGLLCVPCNTALTIVEDEDRVVMLRRYLALSVSPTDDRARSCHEPTRPTR